MNKYMLNYDIKINSFTEKLLDVKLVISNAKNNLIKLYKGKIKFSILKCNIPIKEDSNYYYIENSVDTLIINYTVKINTPGKHGLYGDTTTDLTVFAGEQFLLLPIEALTSNDNNIGNINIDYKFDTPHKFIVPFNDGTNKTKCSSIIWSNIYELMKSSYVFGKLSDHNHTHINSNLNIYSNTTVNISTIDNIKRLFNYYNNLFNNNPKYISLVLLGPNDKYEILGGCGRNIICSTFDESNIRDWQLLSHRLFHSFMDSSLPSSTFHTPPTLWITEGLATYYENIALESLDKNYIQLLNINPKREFTMLFNRYLYTSLKRPQLFSFPPMEEINIHSGGKIEFLHYTQGPLVIKLIEDMYYLSKGKDVVLNEIIKLYNSNNFNLQTLFTNILGNDVNIFASKYLFSNELLPMWYLKDNTLEDESSIISDLNYYEYILYSWMSLDDSYYIQDELSSTNLPSFNTVNNDNNVLYNSTLLENKIKTYSPTIYRLLKKYFFYK